MILAQLSHNQNVKNFGTASHNFSLTSCFVGNEKCLVLRNIFELALMFRSTNAKDFCKQKISDVSHKSTHSTDLNLAQLTFYQIFKNFTQHLQ